MLNKKCLILHGALSLTALFNKSIPLAGWVLGAQVTAGSLQLAGQQKATKCRRRSE